MESTTFDLVKFASCFSVGMGTLTIDGEAEGVTFSFIRADSAVVGNVSADFPTEVAFDEQALEGILVEGEEPGLGGHRAGGFEVERRRGGDTIQRGHGVVRRRRGGRGG
jgi:hypothetical protein